VSAGVGIILRSAIWEFSARPKVWHELVLDLSILVGCYATVSIAAFIVNLFRTPALLDADCQKEIADLSAKLELPDKAQADYLRGLVSKLSDQGKAILRFALLHEEITNKQLSTILPSWPEVEKGYRECLDLGLLKWRNDCPERNHPMIWVYDAFWVPDTFRTPLQRILYEF
jgi:hypothetical protein